MPRVVPHFKVRLSVQNHRKTIAIYGDDALLAMWVRVGVMAVERFADRTDDSFLASGLDLCRLAGVDGVANAIRKLRRLEASGGPALSQEQAGGGPEVGQTSAAWRLTFNNFAEKQGFQKKNGSGKEVSASASSAATSTKEQEKIYEPAAAAAPPPAPKRPKSVKAPETPAPFMLDLEQQAALRTWCAEKHPEALPRLGALVEACLDHHLALGNRRADWVATCRTWIRNEPRFGPARPRTLQAKADEAAATTAAAAELIRANRKRREDARRGANVGVLSADVRQLRPVCDA